MKVTVDPWRESCVFLAGEEELTQVQQHCRGIYLEWLMITMYQSELLIAISHYPRVLSPESRSKVNVVHFHIPHFSCGAIVATLRLRKFFHL